MYLETKNLIKLRISNRTIAEVPFVIKELKVAKWDLCTSDWKTNVETN